MILLLSCYLLATESTYDLMDQKFHRELQFVSTDDYKEAEIDRLIALSLSRDLKAEAAHYTIFGAAEGSIFAKQLLSKAIESYRVTEQPILEDEGDSVELENLKRKCDAWKRDLPKTNEEREECVDILFMFYEPIDCSSSQALHKILETDQEVDATLGTAKEANPTSEEKRIPRVVNPYDDTSASSSAGVSEEDIFSDTDAVVEEPELEPMSLQEVLRHESQPNAHIVADLLKLCTIKKDSGLVLAKMIWGDTVKDRSLQSMVSQLKNPDNAHYHITDKSGRVLKVWRWFKEVQPDVVREITGFDVYDLHQALARFSIPYQQTLSKFSSNPLHD